MGTSSSCLSQQFDSQQINAFDSKNIIEIKKSSQFLEAEDIFTTDTNEQKETLKINQSVKQHVKSYNFDEPIIINQLFKSYSASPTKKQKRQRRVESASKERGRDIQEFIDIGDYINLIQNSNDNDQDCQTVKSILKQKSLYTNHSVDSSSTFKQVKFAQGTDFRNHQKPKRKKKGLAYHKKTQSLTSKSPKFMFFQ